MTIQELSNKLNNKEISSVEVTKDYLEKIKGKDEKVHAYITVTEEEALAAANAADEKLASGENVSPLCGVPMSVKDNICTKSIKTTCASKILGNFIPPYSATLWNKLEGAGSVILGKVNLDEFAMGVSTETSYFGVTKNPYDLGRVSGGSSGGSAACVAADMAVYSIGTDTGGSVRQPASYCGVVGVKPTYGRVSRYGLVAYASSLDQAGVLAQNVGDAALVLSEMSGLDSYDSTTVDYAVDYMDDLNKGCKDFTIGVPKEYFENIDNDVKDAIYKALKTYESLGAKIEEFSMDTVKYALPAYYIIGCAEASSNLAMFDGVRYGFRSEDITDLDSLYKKSRSEGFGAEVKRRIMLGTYALSAGYYDAYYKKALKVRTLVSKKFDEAFSKYDVIITPVSPSTAFEIGENENDPVKRYMADICTTPINLAGLPAMSVPCGYDSKNLPIGMQILAKPFNEKAMFRAGAAFEAAADFAKIQPEI